MRRGRPDVEGEPLGARTAQLLGAILHEGGDWGPGRAALCLSSDPERKWVDPAVGYHHLKRLEVYGYLERLTPKGRTYRLKKREPEGVASSALAQALARVRMQVDYEPEEYPGNTVDSLVFYLPNILDLGEGFEAEYRKATYR